MGNSSTKTTPEIPQENPHSNQPSIPLNEYFARSENLITSFGCWEPYEATLKCISKIDRASPEQKRTLDELRGEVMKNCPKEVREVIKKCPEVLGTQYDLEKLRKMACKIAVDEEDQVDKMIRNSGCWDHHTSVVNCMNDAQDWRKCQSQLQEFRKCMLKNNAHQFIKTVQEESAKTQIQASKEAPKS
uniref:Uncharacterized protein n=1 Tax=Acrobeloides nanus TaxID=290746 RepID=A0A914BWD4_9BILA